MIDVPRFPVVIVASPRTGSTALLKYLANKYSVMGFGEIFKNIIDLINSDPVTYKKTLKQREIYSNYKKLNRTDYILKLMPGEITYFSKYEDLLQSKDCFKIRLSRKSLINQVASLYIAESTKNFHTYSTDQLKNYEVKIDKINLIHCIERISNSNFLVKNIKCDYDLDIDYEDLGYLEEIKGEQAHTIIFHKPTNFEEVKKAITDLIKFI